MNCVRELSWVRIDNWDFIFCMCTFELTHTRSHRTACVWWQRWRRQENLISIRLKIVLKNLHKIHTTSKSEWNSCYIWPLFLFFLLLSLSLSASIFYRFSSQLQVCIYFAMSTYKEYIGKVVCLTLATFNVCISFVHIRRWFFLLFQFLMKYSIGNSTSMIDDYISSQFWAHSDMQSSPTYLSMLVGGLTKLLDSFNLFFLHVERKCW